MIEAPAATAWYVFGVVPSDATPPDGTQLVERGALAAVAAEVPLAEFGEDVLPARLNDRAWLEDKVRIHEAVLEAFVGSAPVVPFRFGALYRDLADVRRLLDERAEHFASVLARVRGCTERGVKAWYDAAAVERPAATGGRAYLERRRGELSSARDAAALAAAAHERFAAVAIDAIANRPQPRELTGRDERMLLNGAYLVRGGDGRLEAEVARLGEEHAKVGITYELTGPWPPYNFAGEEDS